VADLLADEGRRFIVATHRNPDGDAIGSMLGLGRALAAAGRDVILWHADPDPVPAELAFLLAPGERVSAELPDDAGERTLFALDCASAARLADRPPGELAGLLVNVDHHHDNTRFGAVNLVDGTASSTAELVLRVLRAAGLGLTREVAEPLYVGLITDTGRFGYSNATPEAHRAAAELIEAGVDPVPISRRLYEEQPLANVLLLGRALAAAQALLGGRLVLGVLREADFAASGTEDTEGIPEALRGVRGAEVAALAREVPEGWRISLRAAGDAVDVSAIAREAGGGGHRAAAGGTFTGSLEELRPWLERAVAAQLDG
jgi:phosphoesterase RecJ-like protein